MGEAKQRAAAAVQEARVALGVEAIGGRVQVRWNQREAATPFGQMAYFIEFVHLTGVYQRWIESCPLHLASPNGSKMADILGTLFLSVLAGHRRYAHIAALRADGVSAALLGMDSVVSEDTFIRMATCRAKAGHVAVRCARVLRRDARCPSKASTTASSIIRHHNDNRRSVVCAGGFE